MIKNLLAGILIWFCVFGNNAFAQKEHNIWYFAHYGGLDFNSGGPVLLTNSAMDQWEGCSSISDGNGNILFYTSGIKVWDRNHNQMPNGFNLAGGNSSTQSALIIPFVGNNFLYYIFTVGEFEWPPIDFNYSVVDMSLNSGNGDVTIKNNMIKSPVTEKLTAVRHSNGSDIWVMVHGMDNDSLFAYLITGSGVAMNPVISKIGQVISSNQSYDAVGCMKFSPDGSKLAFAAPTSHYVNLFDFNSTTGVVTNEKYLAAPVGCSPYGLEFSGSGNYLYCSAIGPIFQWNITSNNDSVINASRQQITPSGYANSAMQLGPDGKIYIARNLTNFVGVINFPDSSGVSCNYVSNAVSLGIMCGHGLPNFITSYFLPTGINTNHPLQNELTISPNPATDKITISFAATTTESVTIKIYSITGEVVFAEEKKSTSPITGYQIPVTNFTNGIYFLSVQTDGEVITKKIVVNH